MNTDALHVSTRRLTSFQHGKRPYSTHINALWQLFFFFLHCIVTLFCYMVIFIHDSVKLNVTTVEETSPNEVKHDVTMDAMRCGCLCGVMSPWRDAMWWCHVSKWSTNHWQQCGNTEINNNRIQLSKKRQQEQQQRKEKDITTSCFVSAPESPALKWFASDWQRRVFWGVDKLAKTFCCALCLYL